MEAPLWHVHLLSLSALCYIVTTDFVPDSSARPTNDTSITTTAKFCSSLSGVVVTNVLLHPPNQEMFAIGDVINFTCDDTGGGPASVLIGQSSATCTATGHWNISDMPHCAVSCYPLASLTLTDVSCHHAGCSATYHCPTNLSLLPVTCSSTGLWLPDPLQACNDDNSGGKRNISGEAVSEEDGEWEGGDSLDDWQLAFTTFTQWVGTLSHDDVIYDVTFRTTSLPDDNSMNASLLIDNRFAVSITVVQSSIQSPGESPASSWTRVLGALERHVSGDTWVYTGRIVSSSVKNRSAGSKLVLKPYVYTALPRSYKPLSASDMNSSVSSSTAMLLGVTIAVAAILAAAGLATYCVRHKLDVACTLPRSFSSFENPVYDVDTTAINRPDDADQFDDYDV